VRERACRRQEAPALAAEEAQKGLELERARPTRKARSLAARTLDPADADAGRAPGRVILGRTGGPLDHRRGRDRGSVRRRWNAEG
jgi:hypothetical protein